MVHIVGAGCGAPDLITVRGANLLSKADVIIYAGSLVNPALLDYANENCKMYNSAKLDLDEVIEVIKDASEKGLDIVRLHTGDPCLYGAIREQMDKLDELDIAYDNTPGVSSFCGAAAALQAEYTLPDVSQSVIITRMAGRTPVPERESIRSFAAHNATMVIFLSAGMTEMLQKELIAGGYKEDTEVAIVYKATWPDQKIVRCTCGTLHESAVSNGIKNLALIAVGDFLGNDYELSKLYDPAFTTSFRNGSSEATNSSEEQR